MAQPPRKGKRAQHAPTLIPKLIRLTAGQVAKLGQVRQLNDGMNEADAIRLALNAGFRTLGVTDPAVAGSIGLAGSIPPQQQRLNKAA